METGDHVAKYKQLHYLHVLLVSNIIFKVAYFVVEADMKREMERKELERKKSPKMEFVSGGTQPGVTVVTAPKINIPFSGLYQLCSSLFLIVMFFFLWCFSVDSFYRCFSYRW